MKLKVVSEEYDYELMKDAPSVWIVVDGIEIYIQRMANSVVVEMFRGDATGAPLRSCALEKVEGS